MARKTKQRHLSVRLSGADLAHGMDAVTDDDGFAELASARTIRPS